MFLKMEQHFWSWKYFYFGRNK